MRVIRKARRSDLKTIVSLWKELAAHHSSFGPGNKELAPHLARRPGAAKNFASWARKHIGSRNGAVFLAEIDAKPAGYCLIFIRQGVSIARVNKFGYISDL